MTDQTARNLSSSVLLSEAEAAETARLLRILMGQPSRKKELEQDLSQYDSPIARPGFEHDKERLRDLAKRTFLARRARLRFVSPAMVGEPAWDMLLVLYATAASHGPHTISKLTAFTGASPTTALRWIDYLTSQGLVRREDNPTDKRVVLLSISEKGTRAMDGYFSEIIERGLPE
jgi:hypothetical protein